MPFKNGTCEDEGYRICGNSLSHFYQLCIPTDVLCPITDLKIVHYGKVSDKINPDNQIVDVSDPEAQEWIEYDEN